MKIARLIVTLECSQSCEMCCNKGTVFQQAKTIASIDELTGFDMVLITGGEPLLDAPRTLQIIQDVREKLPDAIVYLYTAWFSPLIGKIEEAVAGIQYTVHGDGGTYNFHRTQSRLVAEHRSHRLCIDRDVSGVFIQPGTWLQVKLLSWIPDCPLPPNETLFILKDGSKEVQ